MDDAVFDGRTLVPRDWEAFRAEGHRMLDDVINFLKDVRPCPIWQKPSEEAQALLSTLAPKATNARTSRSASQEPIGLLGPCDVRTLRTLQRNTLAVRSCGWHSAAQRSCTKLIASLCATLPMR